MTPFIEEAARLLRLAERDYQSFSILANHPGGDQASACFHAQQSVEKALKAVLTLHQTDFRRTHDLETLAALIIDLGIALPVSPRELRRLNPYAVAFRYDDQRVQLVTREDADRMATAILEWARSRAEQAGLRPPG